MLQADYDGQTYAETYNPTLKLNSELEMRDSVAALALNNSKLTYGTSS